MKFIPILQTTKVTSTYVEEFSEAAQVKYCKFKLKEF